MTTRLPLARLIAAEARLFLREPAAVFFAVFLPVALLLALGATIPGFREPVPALGGNRVVDVQLPAMMTLLTVVTLALSTLPTALVVYRERGVLRRMFTTPVRPGTLLAAQLVIYFAVSVVSVALILVLGNAVLGVPYPRALGAFAGSYLLGALTLFALGLWLAAVAPNSRVVQGAGSAAMFPLLFFAGMWLPRRLMPEVLRRISDLTPTGALGQLFTDAFAGHPPEAFHLAVAAGWAVAAGLAAARMFRWE